MDEHVRTRGGEPFGDGAAQTISRSGHQNGSRACGLIGHDRRDCIAVASSLRPPAREQPGVTRARTRRGERIEQPGADAWRQRTQPSVPAVHERTKLTVQAAKLQDPSLELLESLDRDVTHTVARGATG